MLTKALVLTDREAELLSCALVEVKTKIYQETEEALDDTQPLDALLWSLRTAETEVRETEKRHVHFGPLGKRLVLGSLLDRPVAERE